eukprot:3936041-Rhodomonas_salina.1
MHPLEYLSGVVYDWQRKFSSWHNKVKKWTSKNRPKTMVDAAADYWVDQKAEASKLMPFAGSVIANGFRSKGVTLVPEVDERVCRRDVDLGLGYLRCCLCKRPRIKAIICKHCMAVAEWCKITGGDSAAAHGAWVRFAMKPQYWVETWARALEEKQLPKCPSSADCRQALWLLPPSSADVSMGRGPHSEKRLGHDRKGKKPTDGQRRARAQLEAQDAAFLNSGGVV